MPEPTVAQTNTECNGRAVTYRNAVAYAVRHQYGLRGNRGDKPSSEGRWLFDFAVSEGQVHRNWSNPAFWADVAVLVADRDRWDSRK